jgi:hypothetical protein
MEAREPAARCVKTTGAVTVGSRSAFDEARRRVRARLGVAACPVDCGQSRWPDGHLAKACWLQQGGVMNTTPQGEEPELPIDDDIPPHTD